MPMTSVRQPAVAGTFYPGDARELESTVRDFLSAAAGNGPVPKALIAPHAGYVYSGAVAAEAYARLADGFRSIWASLSIAITLGSLRIRCSPGF